MKILKNNYNSETRITCHCCDSELLVDGDDIKHNGDGDRYVICAACGAHIFIKHQQPAIICDGCGEPVEPQPYIGWNGCEWVKCDKCGEETFVSDGIELTAENVSYPQHFRQTPKSAAQIADRKIQQMVRECVAKIGADTDYSYTMLGDTAVIAFKSDGEVMVLVCKNYAECYVTIPGEEY